jgi:D-glycero-alpha-D-manno-heptose-7-phosphate kinase
MIIARTPYRISFFGGGTDYPSWYREHGGAVIAATIDKYCYLTVRYLPPFFEHRHRVVWSKIEQVQHIDEITHPAVRGILKYANIDRGLEVHHDGDLPARSGMGSSSAFTVSLLNALHGLNGRIFSKHKLALEAIHVEQNVLKETVGSQDQVSAAYGGFNHIRFLQNGEISVSPITISNARAQELDSNLMLFYTGIKRTASEVASTYVQNINEKKRQLRIMHDMVQESVEILASDKPINDFGALLDETWQIKRGLSNTVTNDEVDAIYAKARAMGAIGGKLLGAGGGGFMLIFAPLNYQERIRHALSDLIHVPFRFEYSGSQIIFLDHQNDYQEEEQRRKVIAFSTTKELHEIGAAIK